ncbi:hypothetical protein [Marinisporobacter balticus]|uniref:Uncharacterized protein n=1 Tax=Marinisporobacter balticus TaxID=2018667 RepID=A0A4V2SC38_9FIRM|nr:hypothetical protein [Marinisporobacter balticus]TCO77910.1 hypothetical protein EV214_1056 [Marinisporobacter balticus]
MNNDQIQSSNYKCKPIPDRLVNALVKEVIFKEVQVKEIEEVIKICKNIKSIEGCNLEVCRINVYDSEDKNDWIIFIEFKLTISYMSKYGYSSSVKKVIYYEKEVPKPLQVKNYEENYEFAELFPCVSIPRAECLAVDFDNVSYFCLITAVIEFKVSITVIAKKELLVMSYLPDALNSTKD